MHLQEKNDKLIAGHLAVKKDYYYCVLNIVENGKRKPKWIATHLKVKGNKTRANDMLQTLRLEWTAKLNADEPEITDKKGACQQGVRKGRKSKEASGTSVTLKRNIKAGSGPEMDFVDFLDVWLDYKYKLATEQTLEQRTNELSTYAGYETNVNFPIRPYFSKHVFKLCELTQDDIKAFYTKQLERVKVSTVKHYHAAIHNALNYAKDQHWITSNPSDGILFPKGPKFKGDYYSDVEVKEMFGFADDPRLELAVVMACFYSLRRSEVIGLKWPFFDFNNDFFSMRNTVTECRVKGKKVLVKKERGKTDSSVRTYPLVSVIKEKLLALKAEQEENRKLCGRSYNTENLGYVFVDAVGNLMKPSYLTDAFRKFLEKNNLRHIRFHDLRHTTAALLMGSEVPIEQVQEWMGHSEISTTVNMYGHLEFSTKRVAASKISARIL